MDYLDQFIEFGDQISRSVNQNRQAALARLQQSQRVKAARRQQEDAAKHKQAAELYKEIYDGERPEMYSWMQRDLDLQAQALFQQQASEEGISDEEAMRQLQDIHTASTKYEGIYKSQIGTHDDPSNSGTYFGNINAITQWATTDVNPYEDIDMIPILFQKENGLEIAANEREMTKQMLSLGLGKDAQYVGSGYDEHGTWMINFINPQTGELTRLPREKVYEKSPAGAAFMFDMTDINFKDMRQLAADPAVMNYVGDSRNFDELLTKYFNSEIMGQKRGRKHIWNQYGEDMFPDEPNLRQRQAAWSDLTLMEIPYNNQTGDLDFSGVQSPIYQEMTNRARGEFIAAFKDLNRDEISGRYEADRAALLDSEETMNDINYELFNKEEALKAYGEGEGFTDNLRTRIGRFVGPRRAQMYGLPSEPDALDNIERLTAVPSTEFEAGSNDFVVAVALDKNGDMIAKVVTKSQPELTEEQIQQGYNPALMPVVESVEYRMIPDQIRPNFEKAVGEKINPDAQNYQEVGLDYLQKTYITGENQQEPPMIFNPQSGQRSSPADPLMPSSQSTATPEDIGVSAEALLSRYGRNPDGSMNNSPDALQARVSLLNTLAAYYESIGVQDPRLEARRQVLAFDDDPSSFIKMMPSILQALQPEE